MYNSSNSNNLISNYPELAMYYVNTKIKDIGYNNITNENTFGPPLTY